MRFATLAIAAFVFVGCATPISTPEDASPTPREGVIPASSDTRSELGVDEWHVRESSDDMHRTSEIEGVAANGTVRARVGVRWSVKDDARIVDIRIGSIRAVMVQTRGGEPVIRGDDAIRADAFALSTARHLAADLGEGRPLRADGLVSQNLVIGGGQLVAEDPQFNKMVVACMGSMIRDGWTDYAGIRSFCLAMHGTR